MSRYSLLSLLLWISALGGKSVAQQVTGQDLDTILERADKTFEEAKTAYEEARGNGSVPSFVNAGFKLEDARIKYIVLQEIGSPEKQKLAADRLRAVNQLSKLIHDGKVAVAGTPAESAASKPADPAAPKDPAPDAPSPSSPLSKPPVDVSKRAPVPDAAKQRDSEKLIKDLFKEQYAKKAPADRKVLARLLMEQAAKTQDDPAALWVLCRETQDIAIQGADVAKALEAVETTARIFDVDGMALRNAALTGIAKTAKAPEDFSPLTEALLKLVEEYVSADLYDAADKTATAALQNAKRSGDATLVSHATLITKEVTEAKSLYQALKSVQQTLAKTPDDPSANLEFGKFLCFVKGNWDLGLRFVVKGSDTKLKALAEKELVFPIPGSDLVTLGDGWSELADKDKSPLRKSRMIGHAKSLYENALPESTGLQRAKLEKRLREIEPSAPVAGGDMLKRIDLSQDTIKGTWKLDGAGLSSPVESDSRIQIPYAPPDEYDLKIVVERKMKTSSSLAGGLYIGLAQGDHQFGIEVDRLYRSTNLFCVEGRADGAPGGDYQGTVLGMEKPHTILCKVRKKQVELIVDDKKIVDWKADYSKVSVYPNWRINNPRAMCIGAQDSSFLIKQISLVTVTGQGKSLR